MPAGGPGGDGSAASAVEVRVILSDPAVRSVLINIFGGITRGDVVAQGITEALSRVRVEAPIVVRLAGTNAEEGRRILADAGLTAVDTMDEAAAAAVAAARVEESRSQGVAP